MMIANVLNARLLANGVVEVHGTPARDEKDVAHAPIREPPDDVIRKLHERRASERTSERTPDWRSEFECGSSERTGLPSPRRRIWALISPACNMVAMMIGSQVPAISWGPSSCGPIMGGNSLSQTTRSSAVPPQSRKRPKTAG